MPIRNHSRCRRLWDAVYGTLTPFQWPARLAWRIHPQANVTVDEHTIRVPLTSADGNILRIAFASDFHAGPATPWPLLEAAVARLADLRADLVLFGGDFVSINPDHARQLACLLGTVAAPFGRFAVLGNHDYWAGASTVRRHLEAAGIEMLTNRAISLRAPFERVSLCGLDDHTSGEPDADRAFAGARDVRLLLMHAPSGLLDIGERPFNVAFCGHTHGGQFALPNGRPLLVAHGRLSRRYNAGCYPLSPNSTLLVSRGVGCGTLPVRWNSPSALLLCSIIIDTETTETEGSRYRRLEPAAADALRGHRG